MSSTYTPLPPEQFKAAFEQAKRDRAEFDLQQQLRDAERAGEALLAAKLRERRQEKVLDFAI